MVASHLGNRRLLSAVAAALFLMLALVGAALAHEHREVGPYEITVGWVVEPALVNQPNGLDLRVALLAEAPAEEEEHTEEEGETHSDEEEHAHGAGEPTPVEGLEETLQAEIIYGDQMMPLELRASFGEPGSYTADVIPTVTGSYIFHIFGEIEGTQIDETFNSADGEFSDIEPLEPMQFPSSANAPGQQTLVASQQDVNNARLFGIGGLVLGALGLLMGGLAMARR
jgi:hypothetical protein